LRPRKRKSSPFSLSFGLSMILEQTKPSVRESQFPLFADHALKD
jgi:hypothetical protein